MSRPTNPDREHAHGQGSFFGRRKGHKLRIAISASNQAEGVWSTPQQAAANGNVSTILNDPAHPSSVVLPLVPAALLN